MSIKKNGEWQFEKKLATTIKETLFDTGVVGPTSYEKADIIAAKYKHSNFLIDEDVWCVAFRRAACEYLYKRITKKLNCGVSNHGVVIKCLPTPLSK